jgi:MFS family permease
MSSRSLAPAKSSGHSALRPFRALAEPNYRWYWISGFGMAGAQGLTQFSITWLVLDLTGSVASLGLVIVAQGFPMSVISLFGGVFADRYDRRMLLIGAQAVSMVSIFLLAVLTLLDLVALWHVFANSILLGATQSLTGPARQALISDLVAPEQRINAIALNSVQQHASRIVWPSLAAALITLLSVGPALLVTAGCFLLGIIGLLLIKGVRVAARARPHTPVQELMDGIRYTKSTPGVSRVIGLTLIFGLSSLAFIQMAPGYARAGLGFNAAETGLFMLCLGVGAVLGGTVFTAVQVRATAGLSILSMAGFSATLVLFAVNPWYVGTFVIAIVHGLMNAMQVILPNALFQNVVPSSHLGRVISLWFLAAGLAALSALPIGLIGEEYGLQFAFACAGAIFIVAAFWFGFLRDRVNRLTARTRPSADAVQP